MPTRNLEDACSFLREAVPQLLDKFNGRYQAFGRVARVGDVLRTTEEQQAEYAIGRTTGVPGKVVTHADGIHSISNHQAQAIHGETCSHAVDVNIFTLGGYLLGQKPGEEHVYYPLIGLACALGIKSGGDWMRPDLPHLACPYGEGL